MHDLDLGISKDALDYEKLLGKCSKCGTFLEAAPDWRKQEGGEQQ